MRTLKFIVEDQIVKQDPNCDFSGLVPGTKGYLQAEFSFSSAWDGYVKVAAFHSIMGREYEPQPLENGTTCMIPAEACAKKEFRIQVLGKKGDDRIVTDKFVVVQNGGKA